MAKKSPNISMQQALLRTLETIDNQVAREMQRSPSERETLGVRKWEPFQKRLEQVATTVIDGFAEDKVKLDSMLVVTQGLAKALSIMIDELGSDGLGKVRTEYALDAMENIKNDAVRAVDALKGERAVN